MGLWIVAFDATVSIGIEADAEDVAVNSAEEMVENIREKGLILGESIDLSIGEIFLIKNEETGVEILK